MGEKTNERERERERLTRNLYIDKGGNYSEKPMMDEDGITFFKDGIYIGRCPQLKENYDVCRCNDHYEMEFNRK